MSADFDAGALGARHLTAPSGSSGGIRAPWLRRGGMVLVTGMVLDVGGRVFLGELNAARRASSSMCSR